MAVVDRGLQQPLRGLWSGLGLGLGRGLGLWRSLGHGRGPDVPSASPSASASLLVRRCRCPRRALRAAPCRQESPSWRCSAAGSGSRSRPVVKDHWDGLGRLGRDVAGVAQRPETVVELLLCGLEVEGHEAPPAVSGGPVLQLLPPSHADGPSSASPGEVVVGRRAVPLVVREPQPQLLGRSRCCGTQPARLPFTARAQPPKASPFLTACVSRLGALLLFSPTITPRSHPPLGLQYAASFVSRL